MKIVAAGDSVGKTCLFTSYLNKAFPKDYVPTVTDANSQTIVVDGKEVEFFLVDVASRDEESKALRFHTYPQTDVFLLCFSVVDKNSFDNISKEWAPEITQHCPGVPFLLVGTKIDLREESNAENSVSTESGISKAKEINAVKYLECSAMTLKGLKEVVEEAIRACNVDQTKESKPEKKKKDCIIS
eukprot:TRINITY_DN10624_c0_g1_i1.p1 TRINITY_DN10624_c0_g1~~TRINITY_DN10624_c0_g1_i1.p1  ORF type:complete len:193 (+),score=61.33 TRINITY_DN10624_c0_g1_i1:23-580(+)